MLDRLLSESKAQMGDDFESRRRIVEMLDVQATLTAEDEQKVVNAWCVHGERVGVSCPGSQMNWLLSASSMAGYEVTVLVQVSN